MQPVDGLMRRIALLLLLFAIALPAFAANPISVEALEQLLAAAPTQDDARVARKLSNLELTQRLNSVKKRVSSAAGEGSMAIAFIHQYLALQSEGSASV
jgi:hypothetical protein